MERSTALLHPVLLYASENWAPTVFNIAKLQRNDQCMTRWICNTKLSDNISSATILEKLGLVDIDASLSQNRLSWFGHVSRDTESINEAMKLDVVGHRGRERPKKTWEDCIISRMTKKFGRCQELIPLIGNHGRKH